MTFVLFHPLIVMDTHRLISVRFWCFCIILGDMRGGESIATPPGLCTLFHGTVVIAVVNLFLFQNCLCFCKMFFAFVWFQFLMVSTRHAMLMLNYNQITCFLESVTRGG